MTDEQRESLTEARLWALAGPQVLPLLAKRKKVAFDRLMLAFREGRTDNLALTAELAVLTDLEREINQKEQIYRTMEEQNGNANRRK
jgi:hypothetical protein